LNFKQKGILGLSPTNRTELNGYTEYLYNASMISTRAYTCNMNLIGSRSRILFGYFNESYHILDYSLN